MPSVNRTGTERHAVCNEPSPPSHTVVDKYDRERLFMSVSLCLLC